MPLALLRRSRAVSRRRDCREKDAVDATGVCLSESEANPSWKGKKEDKNKGSGKTRAVQAQVSEQESKGGEKGDQGEGGCKQLHVVLATWYLESPVRPASAMYRYLRRWGLALTALGRRLAAGAAVAGDGGGAARLQLEGF